MMRGVAALAAAAALLLSPVVGATASAAAPPPFTVSPASLSFTNVPVNSLAYQSVTVTTGAKKVAFDNPATFSASFFSDTQAGTCWQNWGSLGKAVPARTSCTIQVAFNPTQAGPLAGVMTVYACKKSHVDAVSGFLVCDARDVSQTVSLSGTVAFPDLIISGFQWGDGGRTKWGYTLQVQNVGLAAADLTRVGVQGYYGDGTTYPGVHGACGTTFNNGTTLAPGAVIPLVVGCSAAPGVGDTAIGVMVDNTNVLVESLETNNVVFAAIQCQFTSGTSGCVEFNNVKVYLGNTGAVVANWTSLSGMFEFSPATGFWTSTTSISVIGSGTWTTSANVSGTWTAASSFPYYDTKFYDSATSAFGPCGTSDTRYVGVRLDLAGGGLAAGAVMDLGLRKATWGTNGVQYQGYGTPAGEPFGIHQTNDASGVTLRC